MATMAEISAAINLIDVKKQNLHKSFLHLQSQSPSSFNLPFNWSDLDSYFTNLQSSLHSKFNHLQTFHPPSEPTTVPGRPELKSFCQNSDGLGLIRFIALASNRLSILSELPDAYRCAPDAPAMVLDAVASFYGSEFKGAELGSIRNACSIMLEGLIGLKLDVTIELQDTAMEMAVQWNQKRVSSHGFMKKKKKEPEALVFLRLVGAYRLVDRFSIDEIIDCFLIAAKKYQTIDLCRRIVPANNMNNMIQKLIDKDMHVTAVNFIIGFKKTDEFPPAGLLEEQKLRSMRVIEETRRNKKDLRVCNAVAMKEIKALKSIIKCINVNHLESEYPKDSLVEVVNKLEDEVEISKQTLVNDLGSREQPATFIRNLKLIQESHSPHYVGECHSSPLGSGPDGSNASSAKGSVENSKQTPVNDLGSSKQPARAKKAKLNKPQPTAEWAVARPELKSFCENSDGLGLTRFIALATDRLSILCELPDAYRSAPDAPAMVLDAAALFYSPGFKCNERCSIWKGFLFMLEGLLRVKPDITIEMKDKAMEMAVQWNQKLVSRFGKVKAKEQKALGFLLLIEAYGLVDRFSIDEIIDCALIVAMYNKTIDMCRRIIPANNINNMIQKLINKDWYSFAVKFIIQFQKTDEFPPFHLLEERKLRSMSVIEETRRNEKDLHLCNTVTMKEIRALKSIIKCINENHLESEYPKDSVVELVNKLENEVEISKQTLVNDLGSRKKPARPTVESAVTTSIQSLKLIQESHLQKSPDLVVECSISPLGGSNASSAKDSVIELANELKSFCQNSDGLGLIQFIALAPNRPSILSELPVAYRCAPDAPAMVLDAAALFYSPGYKGTELQSFWNGCSFMLKGLLHVKPDITIEMKDKAMEMAVQWNQKMLSRFGRVKAIEQKALAFLLLLEAFGLVDRFSIDDIIDCFLIIPKSLQTIDLCRKIIPANNVNDMIKKFIDREWYSPAVKFIIQLQKTDEFPPVGLLEERKLRSMSVMEETRRNEKDLRVCNAVTMKEIRVLKSIIKCIDENHLESEYPKDSLVELVNKLENEVENGKQMLLNGLGSREQPARQTVESAVATPMQNLKLIQESHSPKLPDHVGECHSSPLGLGPDGCNASFAKDSVEELVNKIENEVENSKQPARATVLKRQLPSKSKMSKKAKKAKKAKLNKAQPTAECAVATLQTVCASSDPTTVPARPKLKSFCQNSDGLGLTWFLALAPDQPSILSELPDAYRYAPDAPAMVLDAVALFYSPGFKGTELRSFWKGCSCMLEGLLHVKPDITIEMKHKAMEIALHWNQKRVYWSGHANTKEQRTLGFLLLVETYGLVDRFSIDEIIDCFLIVAKSRHTIDLCRQIIPANNINDMIQKLIHKNMYVSAVNFSIELKKTDEFPPVGLLEDQKLWSMKVIEETRKNEKDLYVYNTVTMKEIRALKSIIKCIDENHLESAYPKDSVVELVNKLENEVEISKQILVNDLGSRKQPARVTVLKQKLLLSKSNMSNKSKKQKLNETVESTVGKPIQNVESIQETHSQKSDLLPDHVGECHSSPLGSGSTGSNASSGKDSVVELVNKIENDVENSKQTPVNDKLENEVENRKQTPVNDKLENDLENTKQTPVNNLGLRKQPVRATVLKGQLLLKSKISKKPKLSTVQPTGESVAAMPVQNTKSIQESHSQKADLLPDHVDECHDSPRVSGPTGSNAPSESPTGSPYGSTRADIDYNFYVPQLCPSSGQNSNGWISD